MILQAVVVYLNVFQQSFSAKILREKLKILI